MDARGVSIPLSRREREVAGLVAEGLTDREIAKRLFISERTAESHVRQIRNKLGLDNRAQVASWFTRQALAREPAAAQAAPAVSPAPAVRNVPGHLTRFVGRGRELGEIRRLLQRSRLLTITGPGGCGKTRLAVKAVGEVIHRFPAGAWFVDLSPLTDPAALPQALAEAIDVPDLGAGELLRTVADELRSGRCRVQCLVILDNCEHVIDAAASAAAALLAACPQLTVLCTSREPLHVPGETIWKLESLASAEAVQLFVDRAELSDPGFVLDDGNAAAVLEICRQLDGLPLALELAAARAGLTPIGELLGQLAGSLSGVRRRGVPGRQQTMRTAIAWSTDLLEEPERRLFRRLAVFRGGFSLEAARAIGGRAGTNALVESLQDKSLLVRLPERAERFRLLEPICDHALELLAESGELEAAQRDHFAFFAALAERGDRGLAGADQADWLVRLTDDHDNLRAALEHGRGRPPEDRLRLVLALTRFWRVCGHLGEGRAWFDEALADAATASAEVARACNAAAGLGWLQGDLAAARALLESSLAAWREVGDDAEVQRCLANLGVIASTQSDWPAGSAYLEEGLVVARRLGDDLATGIVLGNLGVLGAHLGDHERAQERLTEAERVLRRLGDEARLANALANLGLLAVNRGLAGDAAGHYAASLGIHGTLRQPQSLAECLEGVGWIAARAGRQEPALRLGAAAAALRRSAGAPHRPWSRQVVDGWLAGARDAAGKAADGAWSEGEALSVAEAIALAEAECDLAQRRQRPDLT